MTTFNCCSQPCQRVPGRLEIKARLPSSDWITHLSAVNRGSLQSHSSINIKTLSLLNPLEMSAHAVVFNTGEITSNTYYMNGQCCPLCMSTLLYVFMCSCPHFQCTQPVSTACCSTNNTITYDSKIGIGFEDIRFRDHMCQQGLVLFCYLFSYSFNLLYKILLSQNG